MSTKLDILNDLVIKMLDQYPEVNPSQYRIFRQRSFERIAIIDAFNEFYIYPNIDLIDGLENLEMVLEYKLTMHKTDIYKFQLLVIKNMLNYTRRSYEKYGL